MAKMIRRAREPRYLTTEEQAELARKLADHPDVLDRFLIELLRIARDGEKERNS